MTLGETLLDQELNSRENYVRESARRAVEKAEGKAEHRFAPEPGKNVCKTCGQSYGKGNHTPMKQAFGKAEGEREPIQKDWATWDAAHKGEKLSAKGAHQALLSHGFTHQQSLKYGPHNVPGKKETENVSFYNHPSGRVGTIVSGGKRGTQASVLASGKAYSQPTLAHKTEKAGHTNAEFHQAVGEALAKKAGKHGQPSRPFSPPPKGGK